METTTIQVSECHCRYLINAINEKLNLRTLKNQYL